MPTIPLFVHERHSTEAILRTLDSYKAIGTMGDLFGDPHLDVADQLDAYEHSGPWSNRLVLGDSLQVMNSLLEYEGLGGQVQMIYMDPPYGVKFGSNFQPFVRRRDVKHGQDEDMIREPEMVKAYRDTWELGLHSYLTYLRDRLLLAKELLTESGSIFVQISDENLHHVREVMDEVFGERNIFALITIVKTSAQETTGIPRVCDYLLWYCKAIDTAKFNRLWVPKLADDPGTKEYNRLETKEGRRRKMTAEESNDWTRLPEGAKPYRQDNIVSQRPPGTFPVQFEGRTYRPITALNLAKVRALSGEHHEYLHAEAEELGGSADRPRTENEKPETQHARRIAVVFGPEHGAIDAQQVFEAAREAYFLKFDALYLFGFAIEGKARELAADRKKLRLPCVYISVTPDVAMSDLLKTSKSSEVFAVTGLPDVRVERAGEQAAGGEPPYQVELLGLDIFRPHDLETESIAADHLPCWMLDTDYNGMVFMARQVFFPKTSAWDNLERSLRGRFAEGVWSHLAGTKSEPFAPGIRRQIAVKVIDERGNELMVVRGLG